MLPRSLLSFKEINGIRSLVLELGTMAQCLSPQQLRGWGRRITSSGRPAWATPWGLHWLKNKGEKEKLKTQLFVVNHRRKFKVYYMGRHEHGGTADRHGRQERTYSCSDVSKCLTWAKTLSISDFFSAEHFLSDISFCKWARRTVLVESVPITKSAFEFQC